MLTATVLPYLKRHLVLSKNIYALPFEWDTASKKAVVTTSRRIIWINTVIMVLNLLYVVLMTLHLLKAESFDLIRRLQGALFLLVHVCWLGLRWNWRVDKGSIQLINSLLMFETTALKGFQGQNTIQDKVLGKILKMVELSGCAIVAGTLAILVTVPCTPPFLVSMMTTCSLHGSYEGQIPARPGLLVWIPVLIFETFMVMNALVAGVFYALHGFLTAVVGLLDYLDILLSEVDEHRPVWKSKGQPNPRERRVIWLPASRLSCFMMYRKLQLIAAMLNSNAKDRIMSCLIGLVPCVEIISLFVCIKFHGVIPMPGYTLFPILFWDAGVVNILFISIASLILKTSQKLLTGLRAPSRRMRNTRRSAITKRLNSCNSLRVKFGMNYIDPGTTLVIQNFCISQTVSLLLMSKNGQIN